MSGIADTITSLSNNNKSISSNNAIIAENESKVNYHFQQSKTAILDRGGNVDNVKQIKDLPEAILNIPHDVSLAFHEDNEIAYQKIVPEGAEEYALLKELGGMTYKDDATNTLRDSKVTEIVSHGKNLLPSGVMDASKWEKGSSASRYYLDLPNGWYCISLKLTETPSEDIFFYLNKSTNGGESYTSVNAGYNKVGALAIGYLVTNKKMTNSSFWFKVDNEAGIIYSLWFSHLTQTKLNYLCDLQIEKVELAQEPSASYPPATYAPTTEYTPYREPITYTIPEALQSLEGWGSGLRSASANLTTQRDFYNTYDLNTKQYTKWVSDKITIDGVNIKTNGLSSTAGGISVVINETDSKYADYTAIQLTGFNPSLSKAQNTAYLSASNSLLLVNLFTAEAFATVEEADEWLRANPIELVYALGEPIETDLKIDFDNFLSVEGGGTLEFVNEHSNAVPSTVEYLVKVGG